jgi:uncharacterized membrane protein
MHTFLKRGWESLSLVGLLLGTLFFAASLTPSLLPRTILTQGVLAGASFSVGYGIGVLIAWLWSYLQLPPLAGAVARLLKMGASVLCLGVALLFLWKMKGWQNSIRSLMELPPLEQGEPVLVALVALATAIVVLALGRLFKLLILATARWLDSLMPRRVALLLGFIITALVFWAAGNNLLLKAGLRIADSSLRQLDMMMEPDTPKPTDPLKTGSATSLVRWEELGRMGRNFISTGPSAGDIGSFTGKPAKEPIRVYVGLGSAETPEERAKIALEELKRAGGFERRNLVIIVPTGTGWIDQEAIDPLEYLLEGDVASVGMQYSYLLSWLSLLAEPGYASESARALFQEVYHHWTSLPKETRPRLYLHGLSLGAMNTELSNELFEVLGDPYQGALFSGPPFPSRIWRSLTNERNAGSPEWLPRVGNGSYARFTNQNNELNIPGAEWGPVRVVYLQYASDPITFFNKHDLYREPDWMKDPRGPDVSPEFRWYPVVTFMQLVLDLAMSTTSPKGYGHVFAAPHYINGWVAVIDSAWPEAEIERLKAHFRNR